MNRINICAHSSDVGTVCHVFNELDSCYLTSIEVYWVFFPVYSAYILSLHGVGDNASFYIFTALKMKSKRMKHRTPEV